MLEALALLLSGWAGPMVDGHVHKAAHSGVIAHAGAYHIEVVVTDTRMQLWLLDQDEKTVHPGRGATVVVTLQRPPRQITLRPVGERFEAPFDIQQVIATGFAARVQLRLGGRPIASSFQWTPLDARHRLNDQPVEAHRKMPPPPPPRRSR